MGSGRVGGAPRVSRRVFLGRAGAIATGVALGLGPAKASVAGAARVTTPLAAAYGPDAAIGWVEHMYHLVMTEGYDPTAFPAGFTPPSAARLYGYLGVAMYEAVVAGMDDRRSLAGQLNGMPETPRPSGPQDWPTALSAAASETMTPLVVSEASRRAIAAFHLQQLVARREAGVADDVLAASVLHGRNVAGALRPWIEADGYREVRQRAARHPYTPPKGVGKWQPTHPNFGPAVEPYWAGVRPMILRRATEVTPPDPVRFSTKATSAFYAQAMHTYEVETARVPAQVDIARFWIDNPIMSGLPSGHWMRLIGQVAPALDLHLDGVVEAYAQTGVALADAFLACWTEKYRSDVLRPSTYVRANIDPDWVTLVNTPQFPEYTSGHSVASLAAATVLTHLLGDVAYADTTVANVPGGAPRTRTFSSFFAAAEEAAQSRIYGGIHYPMGVEVGKDQGRSVGELVRRRLTTRR